MLLREMCLASLLFILDILKNQDQTAFLSPSWHPRSCLQGRSVSENRPNSLRVISHARELSSRVVSTLLYECHWSRSHSLSVTHCLLSLGSNRTCRSSSWAVSSPNLSITLNRYKRADYAALIIHFISRLIIKIGKFLSFKLQIKHIRVVLSLLKFWVEVARHNFLSV